MCVGLGTLTTPPNIHIYIYIQVLLGMLVCRLGVAFPCPTRRLRRPGRRVWRGNRRLAARQAPGRGGRGGRMRRLYSRPRFLDLMFCGRKTISGANEKFGFFLCQSTREVSITVGFSHYYRASSISSDAGLVVKGSQAPPLPGASIDRAKEGSPLCNHRCKLP